MAAVFVRSLLAAQFLTPRNPNIMESIVKVDPDWKLPANSWDTHVHVFEPSKYPYSPNRSYSPEKATYESLLAFNRNLSAAHRPQNLVLVQASPYGTDNSLNLDLLKKHKKEHGLPHGKLRAITVFDEKQISDKELQDWNDLGVRGFRINNEASATGIDYEALKKKIIDTSNRVMAYQWHCQLFISGKSWDYIHDTLRNIPIKIIADHQGGMKGTSALPENVTVTEQPGYTSLIKLARTGKVYIKISGFYRSSKLISGGYDDLEPLIKAFAREVPDQLIWASDWPHTGAGANRTEENKYSPEPFRAVDDAAVLQNIKKWVGCELWKKMTVHTPAIVFS